MARGGYRIFDADTHIIEPVEPIEALPRGAADRAKLAALGPLVGRGPAKAGMSRYRIGKRPKLDRRLGSRERVAPPSGAARGARDGGTPWDVRWQGPPFPSDRVSFDPHARVKDMDLEGVDVNMVLPSGGVPAFCGLEDVALEQAMYQAYHRFLADYCAPYPDRLTSLVLVSARDAAASVAEIRRCGQEAWPVGIFPICPPELSLDDPAWEPIWAAAQDARPHRRHPLLHDDRALSAGHVGHLGQRVPAARRRPRVERPAQHGGADRRRRARSLPRAAPDLARVRPRLAPVLGLAPGRAGRDVPATRCRRSSRSRASTSAGRSTSRASSSTRASCRCARPSRRSARRR